MNSGAKAACLAAAVGLLAGCGARPTAPTINESMTQIMEPKAEIAWGIASKAYNAVGDGLDPAKLSGADWAAVGRAGQLIQDRALILADADPVVVAGPNEPIMGSQASGVKGNIGPQWEAADAGTIQARIDANPELFRRHARELAKAGGEFVRAAAGKDVALLYTVSSRLDEVCDGCHEPFWGTDEPPPFPR